MVEPDRCLACVAKVINVEPIPKADKLVKVSVLGWSCVVRKGEFNIGDLGIYFGIDSILDTENPEFSFLGGKPLKTRKILGTISQGLLLPLSILEYYHIPKEAIKEGDDLSLQLKVKKYIPPEEQQVYNNEKSNKIPEHVQKTDEIRIQQRPQFLEEIKERPIVITRKEDGTSTSYIYYKGEFMVAGRNYVCSEDDKSGRFYFINEKQFNIGEKMRNYGRNIAIQGETIGWKINHNRLGFKENEYDFRVFNIWDIDNQVYLSHDETMSICETLGLHIVPVIYKGILLADKLTIDGLLRLAESIEYKPNVPAEGIVIKTLDYPRISFKVVSNKYLLFWKK